jgi:hypothetical protein
MIILDTTTRTVEFKLGATVATNQLPFVVSYVDHIMGTSYTPATQHGNSNGTNVVTILSAPASGTQRSMKQLVIRNRDTVAATVTVEFNDNGTIRELYAPILQVGDTLQYEDVEGFSVVDINGQKKIAFSYSKSFKVVSSSLTADTDIIAAVATKKLKVYAYSLISSGTSANTVIFKSNGTAGTELWRVPLQSSTAIMAGANLAVTPPAYLFATVAGEKLTLDVSVADTLHYSVAYFDDDTT